VSVSVIEAVSFLRVNKVWVNEVAVLVTMLREARERGIDKGCRTARKVDTIL
jgi:hypothetical protein